MLPFLILESDSQMRNLITFSLKSQNYTYTEGNTGDDIIDIIKTEKLSGIILDLDVLDGDRNEFIEEIRQISNLPIMVISAVDSIDEKIKTLDAGADDYLTKPFNIEELLARLRVFLRRQSYEAESKLDIYKFDDLVIDLVKHRVTLEGNEIHLTPMEFDILVLLVRNPGKVLTQKYILKAIWGSTYDSNSQTLRVFMANIRRKLEKNPARPKFIFTEVGVGYRFTDEFSG